MAGGHRRCWNLFPEATLLGDEVFLDRLCPQVTLAKYVIANLIRSGLYQGRIKYLRGGGKACFGKQLSTRAHYLGQRPGNLPVTVLHIVGKRRV